MTRAQGVSGGEYTLDYIMYIVGRVHILPLSIGTLHIVVFRMKTVFINQEIVRNMTRDQGVSWGEYTLDYIMYIVGLP
jgi:hypothetical protein